MVGGDYDQFLKYDASFHPFLLAMMVGSTLRMRGWLNRSPMLASPLFFHEMQTGVVLFTLGSFFFGLEAFFPTIFRAHYPDPAFLILLLSLALVLILLAVLLFFMKEVWLPYWEEQAQEEWYRNNR